MFLCWPCEGLWDAGNFTCYWGEETWHRDGKKNEALEERVPTKEISRKYRQCLYDDDILVRPHELFPYEGRKTPQKDK